mmetsp:Transcript_19694/g.46997  ORF Transcript_19694/g.46997 Transcript_19694/m.46997 type:complete len:227 (-) Transcript_19694:674-1354(-)
MLVQSVWQGTGSVLWLLELFKLLLSSVLKRNRHRACSHACPRNRLASMSRSVPLESLPRHRALDLIVSEIIAATARCLFTLAICFGVLPWYLRSRTAPPTMSSRTQSKCPSWAAMKTAEEPSLVGVLQLAEALTRMRSDSACPFCAAMYTGVTPPVVTVLTLAPASMSACRLGPCPSAAAMHTGVTPPLVGVSMLARALMRRRSASTLPCCAAMNVGVTPLLEGMT